MTRLLIAAALLLPGASAQAAEPVTGFEQRDGASFTTHEEELAFLAEVDAQSPRVEVAEVGRSEQGRPLHLVQIGPRGRPTVMLVCSQHGNEPAGREACLKRLRDLAFTTDPARVALLDRITVLVVPTANPDGRAANTRENDKAIDVNRDHLTLDTPEARVVAQLVLDWSPDVLVDLHEYGPSLPAVYDDSVLWLWPRNLNTDKEVHDAAVTLGRDYLVPAVEAAGYTADEYGQAEVVDNDVAQTAGDGDEGILRNAMGLRHVLGILAETRVDGDARQSPGELIDPAAVARRRVASHAALLDGLEKFMAERGEEAARITADAAARKAAEGAARSAPVFFGGADNQEPTASQTVSPPPCSYSLTDADVATLGPRLGLLGIERDGLTVSLAQPMEPLIPLLLDARGTRHVVEATPSDDCPAGTPDTSGVPGDPSARRCVARRPVVLARPRVRRGKVVRVVRVTANGRRLRMRGRAVTVDLRRFKARRVRVRFVLRVRRGGKVVTRRVVRTLRVCRRR